MTPAKILVVDDVGLMCDHMRSLLRERGHNQVTTATTMEVAKRLILDEKFELIFLDIELHDKNGLDLLKMVKIDKPEIKVVMVSGHSTSENVKQALADGADGFLVKPYSVQRLKGILNKFGY